MINTELILSSILGVFVILSVCLYLLMYFAVKRVQQLEEALRETEKRYVKTMTGMRRQIPDIDLT